MASQNFFWHISIVTAYVYTSCILIHYLFIPSHLSCRWELRCRCWWACPRRCRGPAWRWCTWWTAAGARAAACWGQGPALQLSTKFCECFTVQLILSRLKTPLLAISGGKWGSRLCHFHRLLLPSHLTPCHTYPTYSKVFNLETLSCIQKWPLRPTRIFYLLKAPTSH